MHVERSRLGLRRACPAVRVLSVPLEDYAIIGDCETAALISRGGSIDWLCWPRFDSAACFAALLGTADHGRWVIEAVSPHARYSRRYRGRTMILETRIETADGALWRLADFTPLLLLSAVPGMTEPQRLLSAVRSIHRRPFEDDVSLLTVTFLS